MNGADADDHCVCELLQRAPHRRLQRASNPIVVIRVGDELQQSEPAVWIDQANTGLSTDLAFPVAVWNHLFRFKLDRTAAHSTVLSLSIMDAGEETGQELANVKMDLTRWGSLTPSSNSLKRVPLDAAQAVKAETSADTGHGRVPQLLIACFVGSTASSSGDDEVVMSQEDTIDAVQRLHGADATLELGSSVRVTVGGICQPSSAILEAVTSKATVSETLVARGRLLPGGGTAQVLVSTSHLRIVPGHCARASSCMQFQDSDHPVLLRFELSPSVFDALRRGTDALRIEVEIRLKRLRDWSLSFCVGLACLLQDGEQSQRMPSHFKLLAWNGDFGGVVHASVGIEDNIARDRTLGPRASTTQLFPGLLSTQLVPTKVSVGVREVKATSLALSLTSQVVVKIWSSSSGRERVFTSQPMSSNRDTNTFVADQKARVRAATFEVLHPHCEVFFIEVCRYSRHERNEVLGRCSFTGANWQLEDSASLVETTMKLALAAGDSKQQLKTQMGADALEDGAGGEILVAMSIHSSPTSSGSSDALVSQALPERQAATSLLSNACYGSNEQVENRGVLGIEVLGAYPQLEDSMFAAGDRVQIRLRVPSEHWSHQSQFQEAVPASSYQGHIVSWNERFATNVVWSQKQRVTPELQVDLVIRRKATCASKPDCQSIRPERNQSIRSVSSLLSTSKRRRTAALKVSDIPIDTEEEYRIGGCSLSLCAFFMQSSTRTPSTFLLLAAVGGGFANDTNSASDARIEQAHPRRYRFIPILVKMQLTPAQDTAWRGVNSLVTSQEAQVRGSVFFHIHSASGSFSRRGDRGADLFFVSAAFGSTKISTRCVCTAMGC